MQTTDDEEQYVVRISVDDEAGRSRFSIDLQSPEEWEYFKTLYSAQPWEGADFYRKHEFIVHDVEE